MTRLQTLLPVLLFASLFWHAASFAQEIRYREAPIGNESLIMVSIKGGQGRFILKRSGGEAFTVREKDGGGGPSGIAASYTVRSDTGFLRLELNLDEDGDDLNTLSALFGDNDARSYYITLTDRIPMQLSMKIGAGESRLDLSGLRLRSLSVECGAAAMRIRVSEPNPEVLRRARITAGIGQIATDRLGNLNFESLDFDGGVGECVLDFSGEMRKKSRISADIGLGSMRLLFPSTTGVLARSEDNWLNSAEFAGFSKKKSGVYASGNYRNAERRVLLDVRSGIGSIAIDWK